MDSAEIPEKENMASNQNNATRPDSEVIPSSSRSTIVVSNLSTSSNLSTNSENVDKELSYIKSTDISSLPSLKKRKIISPQSVPANKGKATLITGSPYKQSLMESLEKIAKNKKPVPLADRGKSSASQPSTSAKPVKVASTR